MGHTHKNNNQSINELFEEYLTYGGMPVVPSLDYLYKEEYLNDLFSSILLNDIVYRYNIRDIGILKRLFEFILDNIGKTSSMKSILDYLN